MIQINLVLRKFILEVCFLKLKKKMTIPFINQYCLYSDTKKTGFNQLFIPVNTEGTVNTKMSNITENVFKIVENNLNKSVSISTQNYFK
jgi:hypothetical protein